MSYDLCLWKWKQKAMISPGSAYLRLAEGWPCADVVTFQVDKIWQAMDERFPGWETDQGEHWCFECTFNSNAIFISLGGDAPREVLDWLFEMAEREELFLFDPQQDGSVTSEDKDSFRVEVESATAEDKLEQVQKDFPLLLAKAKEGNPTAQFELGNRYAFGEGIAAFRTRIGMRRLNLPGDGHCAHGEYRTLPCCNFFAGLVYHVIILFVMCATPPSALPLLRMARKPMSK